MASSCARSLVRRSSNTAKSLLFRGQSSHSVSSGPTKLSGLAHTTARSLPRRRPSFCSRLPVELGCGESLMPLHSATASALLKSMLSSKIGRWGFLSEVSGKQEAAVNRMEILGFKNHTALQRRYNRTFNGDAGKRTTAYLYSL